MRNIFFPHYLSGEPQKSPLNFYCPISTAPLFIGLAVFKQKHNMHKQKKRHSKVSLCTPAGARTLDPLIKSQMLYQLSYKRVLNN